jgi:2-polyprenyl-3-methyl-5-hydroxy-6-metoxy-1,4-benzoquinol methylase
MSDATKSSAAVQARTILERYEDLYASGEMSLSKTYADKFPFLEHLLKEEVDGRAVLDFGCGPGRLSLMLARFADSVHGIDFSAPGIEMASLLAAMTSNKNVRFTVGDLDAVEGSDECYDVIVVAGTIEHLPDPLAALRTWHGALVPGGLLVIQCPSFENLRGDIYNTLGKLLGLPMSLTDVWQIHHRDAERWAQELGMELERTVGGHYDLGFLDRALEDLRTRAPKAARDARLGKDWDWDRFFAWMERRVEGNRPLVQNLYDAGILRELPESEPLRAERPDGMDDPTWNRIHEYLTYSGWRERLYTDTEPFCFYGASAVYFLRSAR